jgi:hypothetical protein
MGDINDFILQHDPNPVILKVILLEVFFFKYYYAG